MKLYRSKWFSLISAILTLLFCMSFYSVQAFAVEIEWDAPQTEYEEPADESVPAAIADLETVLEQEQDNEHSYGEPPEIAYGDELTAGTGFRPFTPPGTATVIDNATGTDGKEFYTIMTEAKNVFYLIIDRQRNTENVYFLNAVTEADLLALIEKDGGTIPVQSARPAQTEHTEVPDEEDPTPAVPEPPAEKSKTGLYIFLGIAVLGVGGAAYYFKIVKGKRNAPDDESNIDDYEDEYDYDGEPDVDGESEEGSEDE